MLFNSLLSRYFSEFFKIAKIIIIFKSGDSNSNVNYRPISILPFLSKIFEKLIWTLTQKIEQYFRYKSVLLPHKFKYIRCNNLVS